jgi:hypothetical protein
MAKGCAGRLRFNAPAWKRKNLHIDSQDRWRGQENGGTENPSPFHLCCSGNFDQATRACRYGAAVHARRYLFVVYVTSIRFVTAPIKDVSEG